MAQQTIGVGTVANDGTGDTIRAAFVKANSNFTELYGRKLMIVAASDAPQAWKDLADYQCDGTADNADIQQALTDANGPVQVLLSPGTFTFADGADGTQEVVLDSYQAVSGSGFATLIVQPTGENSNRAFRVEGTSANVNPKVGCIIENMRFQSMGNSSPLSIWRCVDCRVRNILIYGAGPSQTGKAMGVSVREALDCDFSDITAIAGNAGDAHAVWNCVHIVQGAYGCTFRNLRGVRTRSTFDSWGLRGCVVDGVIGHNNDEVLDCGNPVDNIFSNIVGIDSAGSAILFKEEPGTVANVPTRYASNYEYGIKRNQFFNVFIRNYGQYGISTSGGGAASPVQDFFDNSFENIIIENDTAVISGGAAIRLGTGTTVGSGGNGLHTRAKLNNVSISVRQGHGIRISTLRQCKFNNVDVTCNSGSGLFCLSSVLGSSETNTSEDNQYSNCSFTQINTTASSSNLNVALQHERGLLMNNCTFNGGWAPFLITNSVFSSFNNCMSRDALAHGYWVRPALTVDRTKGGECGLTFVQCHTLRANKSSSNRQSWRFEADGNITNLSGIQMIGCRIDDDQSVTTTRNIEWILTNSATFSNVKVIGSRMWTGVAFTLPVGGTGNEIVA